MKCCPWCQTVLPSESAKFCPECGKRLNPLDFHANEKTVQIEFDKSKFHKKEDTVREQREEERTTVLPELNLLDALSSNLPQEEKSRQEPSSGKKKKKDHPKAKKGALPIAVPTLRPASVFTKKTSSLHPKGAFRKVFAILGGTVAVAALTTGMVFGIRYLTVQTAPRAAQGYVNALSAKDISYLSKNTVMDGHVFSYGELEAMNAALSAHIKPDVFRAHLEAMGDPADQGYNPHYSCFVLVQDEENGGFRIQVSPVPVLVQTEILDMTIFVDGREVESSPAEGGLKVEILPGEHVVRATKDSYEAGEAAITAFSTELCVLPAMGQNASKVTLILSGLETNLEVTIDGKPLEEIPTGGVVHLSSAFQGMKVKVSCDQYQEEFTVTADAKQTLEPSWMVEKEGEGLSSLSPESLTNRQLIQHVGGIYNEYYTSYLKATNQQNPELMRNLTSDYRETMIYRMNTYNKDMLFTLKSVTVDKESLQRFTEGGKSYVSFYVQNDYNYAFTAEPDKPLAGGNLQTVTAVYEEEGNQWLICKSVIDDELELSQNVLTYTPS